MSRDIHYRCINSNYLPSRPENWVCDILHEDFISERLDNLGFEGEQIIKFQIPNVSIKEDTTYDLFCFDSVIVEFDALMKFITDNELINIIKDDVERHKCNYILFHFL